MRILLWGIVIGFSICLGVLAGYSDLDWDVSSSSFPYHVDLNTIPLGHEYRLNNETYNALRVDSNEYNITIYTWDAKCNCEISKTIAK